MSSKIIRAQTTLSNTISTNEINFDTINNINVSENRFYVITAQSFGYTASNFVEELPFLLKPGILQEVYVSSTTAPGAGEYYNFTFQEDGVDVFNVVIFGTAETAFLTQLNFEIKEDVLYKVYVEFSAGAYNATGVSFGFRAKIFY